MEKEENRDLWEYQQHRADVKWCCIPRRVTALQENAPHSRGACHNANGHGEEQGR